MPNKNSKKSAKGLSKQVGSPAYLAFLRGLQLMGIALVRSEFEIDRSRYMAERDSTMEVRWSSKPNSGRGNHFDVLIDFVLKVTDNGTGKALFSLSANYVAHMHSEKEHLTEFVKRFTDLEIRLVVWPYFREYVHDITARMYVPPVVLPLAIAETDAELKLRRIEN